MEKKSFQTDLSSLDLTRQEKDLIKNAARYNTNLPFIAIIVFSACYIWLKNHNLFGQSMFFMIYNAIIYLALIWAAFWAYSYQKKISRLFAKLITMIN